MIIFLICMIPVAGFLGFATCAVLQAAAAADRQDEKNHAEWQKSQEAKE